MTHPRHSLISLQDTPYYHCIARCVRRAWLWGYDAYAGQDYSHRKAWVLERLATLSGVFAIDIAAYAIMSNHYHLVLHVDRQRAKAWTTHDVVARWSMIFGVPDPVRRSLHPLATDAEREAAAELIELWRERLHDISWYMRCLNEHLARRANEEDHCKGRFWEGRFKSQALLDEQGLLTAMTYVDLNPVRAGIAATPEESDFTSIYQRIRQLQRAGESSIPLQPFRGDDIPPHADHIPRIPFRLPEYLELLDWTGRTRRKHKDAVIAARLPSIIRRLKIDPPPWRATMQPSANPFGRAIGTLQSLRHHAANLSQAWIHGTHRSRRQSNSVSCVGIGGNYVDTRRYTSRRSESP